MATVALSKEVLQRPQVLPEGSPHQHLGSGHSRQAARIGMHAWQEMRDGRGLTSSQLCNDISGIADKLAVVKLPACPEAGSRPATCALLLASGSDDVVLLPHERLVSSPLLESAIPPSGEAQESEQSQRSAESEERISAAAAALGCLFRMTSADSKAAHQKAKQSRCAEAEGQNVPSCPIVWMVWAESFRDASPSLLLGYALLTSRRESALFLRMATGFGFAQLGDYAGSSLYRLGKRGHRFKCWECGVKKKAPCGDTHRPDLPWCCHRRLGAHLACLATAFTGDSVTLHGNQTSFVPLLPPKETTVISSTQALDFQLGYRPVPTAVVAFTELLSRTAVHPAESINTALGRLSPTCRALWSTHWPTQKRLAALAGDEVAAQELHFWLEETAYFKMPKGQEQELIGAKRSTLEKLVAEAVPHVEGAPCLGGHNRAELPAEISTPEAAAAYLETLSAPPDSQRRNANTGQGRRRLNARAALRQQERSSSPAPALGRPASAGDLPEPSGQPLFCPQSQQLPVARQGSAGLERTRFLPSRSARLKPLACEPDSGKEWVSPASPDEAPQATRRSSPSGLNDMEMEVANELRALQRGVSSTTERYPSASRPLSEMPASRENSMPCSPVPSSPDIARPPKQTRSSVSKRRIAAMSGLSENPNSYRSFSGRGKQRGVASWQQQGAGLRAPDMASKKARLSCSPRKVMHVELEQEGRHPLRDIAFSRQPSSALPADARPPKQMLAGVPQHYGRSEVSQERRAESWSGTLPRADHGGQHGRISGSASDRTTSAPKHPHVPEQEGGQARAVPPTGALPVVLMSPLQLGHVNSCLTLPSELSSKVLAGQLQVLISGHVTPRQAPTSAHTESLGSLLSQVAAHVQGSGPLLKLASAATHGQGMPASTLAPKAGSELEPQPAKKVLPELHPSTVPSRHASQQPASHNLRHPASGAVAQKPGHSLPHVSIQPSLMAPHHGGGRGAGTPWEVLNEGGLLGSADAAVTVQLLPAVKSAVASNKPAEKAQGTSAAAKVLADVDVR
ncbi:g11033 [Coccomyxa viridis]|uniref:G11033 protein n=1 Tax=Coccomyxa viridis TaxID=1274662 RepID=A0ABP1G7A6_9CHLO